MRERGICIHSFEKALRVRPGIYTVRTSAKGYEAKEINDVEIAESQLNELDIELVRVVEEPEQPPSNSPQ